MTKTIFFDLDNTLWDFEKNSWEALQELFTHHDISSLTGVGFEIFHQKYVELNHYYWDLYSKHQIEKETLRVIRFRETLKHFSYDDVQVADAMAEAYISISPYKKNLFPHAHEILQYLTGKYRLGLITNGFNEVQYIKIKSSGIDHYFEEMITSENAGFQKPDKRIFEHAQLKLNSAPHQCLIIGDNYDADIAGARNAGWQAIYFDPKEQGPETDVKKIASLIELKNYL